jgi:hypothetical protein
MKRLIFNCLLGLMMVRCAMAQLGSYTNSSPLNCPPSIPPQIDATNFVNLSLFNIGFNSYNSLSVSAFNGAIIANTSSPFDFSDVMFFTNRGTMLCDTGFLFNNSPSSSGVATPAASFGNGNNGLISGGSVTNSFTSAFLFYVGSGGLGAAFSTSLPLIEVDATNVVNSGVLDVGLTGIIKVNGNHLDLSRGTLHVEGFDDYAVNNSLDSLLTNADFANVVANSSLNLGIFNVYEGIGSQTNELALTNFNLTFGVFSPPSLVTNYAGLITSLTVDPSPPTAYVWTNQINQSNFIYQVVFINTNLPGISTDVRFQPSDQASVPVIQWTAIVTNNLGLPTLTNYLYLSDRFGSFQTNFLITNSFSFSSIPEPAPFNFVFNRSFFEYTNLPHGNFPNYDANVIFTNAFPATNAYAAYEVNVQPVSFAPDLTALASPLTNLPGRIQIAATNWLDLTRATVTGANYLNLYAPTHFVGSGGAEIIVPNMDINVGSTNGTLSISNLVAPEVPRFTGIIDMYSARWTNVVAGVTNTYHVLIVNSGLSPTSPVSVLNFTGHTTNAGVGVLISDTLNIVSNFSIDSPSLTVTTSGEINLESLSQSWSASIPNLRNLTNFGLIDLLDASFFYTVTNNQPYNAFVNHGDIATGGATVLANYMENTGSISNIIGGVGLTNLTGLAGLTNFPGAFLYASEGLLSIQAGTAVLSDGFILSPQGDIAISAGNLIVNTHDIDASGSLTLSVTNVLNDGGAESGNFWQAGDGANLLKVAANGDFLGTTLTLNVPNPGNEVDNVWSAKDLGAVPGGFFNNGALGHLILTTSDTRSQFLFAGPDATNAYAMYVDLIDLQGGTTNQANVNGEEAFTALEFATNMTVYFADATINGFDISEKLNGANGGHLVWVSSYAGIFSGTNVVSSNGTVNTYNRALYASPDIFPKPTPFTLSPSVAFTNSPAKTPVLNFNALANTYYYVYYKTNLLSTNWALLTNYGPALINTNFTFIDKGHTNSSGFYDIQTNSTQP